MHVAVKVQGVADAVQALALHDLGACRGEESLVLVGELAVQVVGHHRVEHGVAQEFQALVVGPAAVFGLDGLGTVHHGQLVEPDVAGVVASDAVYKNIKLLILDEKELYE